MKFKTTKKEITENHIAVLRLPHDYQDRFESLGFKPVAYNYGVYGWNYDVYECYSLAIISGYRGFDCMEIPESVIKIIENHKKYCEKSRKDMKTDSIIKYKNEEKHRKASLKKINEILLSLSRKILTEKLKEI